MAIKDYKELCFKLTVEGLSIVEKSDIVDMFKSYLKRLSKGDTDIKVIAGANLKRRQNLLSYKKQVSKGLEAHKSQLKIYAQKLGLELEDDFVDIINAFLEGYTKTDDMYSVYGCTNSFMVICSDVKITKN